MLRLESLNKSPRTVGAMEVKPASPNPIAALSSRKELNSFMKELAKVHDTQARIHTAINHFREYLSPRNPKAGAEAK